MVFTYNKGTIRSALVCICLCTYTYGEGRGGKLIFKVQLLLMYKQPLSLKVHVIAYYKKYCTDTGWSTPVSGKYQVFKRGESRGPSGK